MKITFWFLLSLLWIIDDDKDELTLPGIISKSILSAICLLTFTWIVKSIGVRKQFRM